MIRSLQSKVKKALSYTKEEQFFIDFARWFQNYARLANDFVNKLANWCGTMQKLFRLEIECSYVDAQKYLSIGKGNYFHLKQFYSSSKFDQQFLGFPLKPPLLDDLENLLSKADEVEQKIQHNLSLSSIDEATMEQLNAEVSVCLFRSLVLFQSFSFFPLFF
jgi:hypothetical protein